MAEPTPKGMTIVPARTGIRVALAAAVAVAVTTGAAGSVAQAGRTDLSPGAVTRWTAQHAAGIETVDPAAPLDDLAPLRRSIGDAQIVGLGESVHGAAEEIQLKHRALRLLVERMGFRSIAWEEDWATGRQIDAYIRGGAGDLDTLVGRMSPQWHSAEVADVLRWLRRYNTGRADQVRFVGVEYYLTGQAAYDAIEDHVARVAPRRLPELREHFRLLRPATPDVFQHIRQYMSVPDKAPYIRASRKLLALLTALPHRPGDRAHRLAVQQARQILYFHVHYNLTDADALVFRDARAAENLRWWRDFSGDKTAYWAASPHTANAPDLRIVGPPQFELRFGSAGSYLRRWYGARYRSVGFTFDHGVVSLGGGETVVMPPPACEWFEYPFGGVGLEQFTVDLRHRAPQPVRRWLHRPVTTRGLPGGGPDAVMTGGTLAQWFDVIVHRQRVTPAREV